MSKRLDTSGGSSSSSRLRNAAKLLESRIRSSRRDKAANSLALAEALIRLSSRVDDDDERFRLLNRAIRLDPYDPRLRVQLGIYHEREGDYPRALGRFREATALAPGDVLVWLQLGRFYLDQLRRGAKCKAAALAIDAFDTAAKIDGECVEAHLGKLEAACRARVSRPEKSYLNDHIPGVFLSIPISAYRLKQVTRAGLFAAFAIHYPRHAPLKKKASDAKMREADRKVRAKLFDRLRTGLTRWIDRFPEDPRLVTVVAVIDLLEASDEALVDALAMASLRIEDPQIFQLFVHQRLEELREPERRAELLLTFARCSPLRRGLDNELLMALNCCARAAVQRADYQAAERLWKESLEIDPYSLSCHHNLALVSLAQNDRGGLSIHISNTVELLLTHWQLAPEGERYLRSLSARFESISERLRDALESALEQTNEALSGELVAAWTRETLTALVLRALVLNPREIQQRLGSLLIIYIRGLRETSSPVIPASLAERMDPALTREAPLHYELLRVKLGAPPSEINRQHETIITSLRSELMQALMQGERTAIDRIGKRIKAVESAFEVLSDPVRRKRYDASCLSTERHEYNLARRDFIRDIHTFTVSAREKGLSHLSVSLYKAYLQVPHENIVDYFDLLQPGARDAIRNNLLQEHARPLLQLAVSRMGEGQWDEGRKLLTAAACSGVDDISHVFYQLAICELKLESDLIETEGALSGPKHDLGTRPVTEMLERVLESCLIITMELGGDAELTCQEYSQRRELQRGVVLDRGQADQGTPHAGARWFVEAEIDAGVRVNGARLRGAQWLEPGDRISSDGAMWAFFPCIRRRENSGGVGVSGFSWARYYLGQAVELASDDESEYVEGLTNLFDAIEHSERHAVIAPAIAHMSKKRWRQALASLERALALQPQNISALIYKAICLLRLGRNIPGVEVAIQAWGQIEGDDDDDERVQLVQLIQQCLLGALAGMEVPSVSPLLARLPAELQGKPEIVFVRCMLRLKLLSSSRPHTLREELQEIRRMLNFVVSNASDPELREAAENYLRQVNSLVSSELRW